MNDNNERKIGDIRNLTPEELEHIRGPNIPQLSDPLHKEFFGKLMMDAGKFEESYSVVSFLLRDKDGKMVSLIPPITSHGIELTRIELYGEPCKPKARSGHALYMVWQDDQDITQAYVMALSECKIRGSYTPMSIVEHPLAHNTQAAIVEVKEGFNFKV